MELLVFSPECKKLEVATLLTSKKLNKLKGPQLFLGTSMGCGHRVNHCS